MTKSNSYKLGVYISGEFCKRANMDPAMANILRSTLVGGGIGAIGGGALGGLEGSFTSPDDPERGRTSHMLRKILWRALQGGMLGAGAGGAHGLGYSSGRYSILNGLANSLGKGQYK